MIEHTARTVFSAKKYKKEKKPLLRVLTQM